MDPLPTYTVGPSGMYFGNFPEREIPRRCAPLAQQRPRLNRPALLAFSLAQSDSPSRIIARGLVRPGL